MPTYYDYEVDDDEGNFAYSGRSDSSNFSGNQKNTSWEGKYPSGEPFVRTSAGVYDLQGRLRVPIRFYESKCVICSSATCIRPHRWFTREGFVAMVALSGLVRKQPRQVLQRIAEQEFGREGHGWNKCEVCECSTVSSRDWEGARDCKLPHRWYTWEGHVWNLLGELGGDTSVNRIIASNTASAEWNINGGVGERSKFEKDAQEDSRAKTSYEYFSSTTGDYGNTSRCPSPPPGWTRSSTGEWEKKGKQDRDRDRRYESSTYGFSGNSRSQEERERAKSTSYEYSERTYASCSDGYRDYSPERRGSDYRDDRYGRSSGRGYGDDDRYGRSYRGQYKGSRFDEL